MTVFEKLDAMVESALPFVRQWADSEVNRAVGGLPRWRLHDGFPGCFEVPLDSGSGAVLAARVLISDEQATQDLTLRVGFVIDLILPRW